MNFKNKTTKIELEGRDALIFSIINVFLLFILYTTTFFLAGIVYFKEWGMIWNPLSIIIIVFLSRHFLYKRTIRITSNIKKDVLCEGDEK